IDVDSDEVLDEIDVVPDSQPMAFLKDLIVSPAAEVSEIHEEEVVPVIMKRNLNEAFNMVAQREGKKRLRKVKIEKE
ncbi:hypothetical protein A2U01_0063428, partial [Trifolium medium]|nr:hypothetical protein [Trifolium medium]